MSKSSLQQIIEARVDGDLQRLSAASLRHVYEIYAQTNRRSLALLGAWQQRESHEVNLCNTDRLRNQIRSAQLGFCPLVLHCRLADDTWTVEPWVRAYGLTVDRAVRLAQEYRQEFVAFSGPGIGAEFKVLWFLKATGAIGLVESFPAFDPMLIAAYFYRRGLAFEYLPRGFFEGMAAGLCERAYRRRR